MKFCKDCRWLSGIVCKSNKMRLNVVTGEPETHLAWVARESNFCGPTAKWFEEKEKPIPKCTECKWCVKLILCEKTAGYLTQARLDESCCGKYGKWFEKKAIPIGGIIEYRAVKLPKSQSWLCKLICGRKK